MLDVKSGRNPVSQGGLEPSLNASSKHPGKFAIPYRWSLVLGLWFAYFLNQGDRQIYSLVLPQLSSTLRMSSVQAGLVVALCTLSLAIFVPLGGWIGDRFDRKLIIVFCLAVWGASSVLSGLVTGIGMLVAVRSIASAAGEAFYTPAASALIAQYHVRTRSLAMSLHQTAMYIGIICSGIISGWIADNWGWRWCFLAFGFAALLLAVGLHVKLLPAPPLTRISQPRITEVVFLLICTPTFWCLTMAFGCLVFVNLGYLTWMPSYLHEHFKLTLVKAGFIGMFWHHAAALGGVMIGGVLSDRLARRNPVWRIDIQAFGLFFGASFLFLLGRSHELGGVVFALVGFGLFRGLYDSNIYTSLFEVVPQRYHSTASGLLIACAFVFGAFAPVLLGFIKDTWGLAFGFSLLGLVFLIGASCLWIGARCYFAGDHSRAEAANLIGRTQL